MLSLNTQAGEYLSYVSDELSKLTVQELASHTSGIRNYSTCMCLPIWEFYSNDEYKTVEASMSMFNNDALLFEPSTDFSYSPYNYTLLSGVMEGAAKKDFLSFMQDEVFEPIGLRQTIPGHREVRMYHHGGSAAGAIAMLILLPEYNVSVAVTTNRSGQSSELFSVAYRMAELLILERDKH